MDEKQSNKFMALLAEINGETDRASAVLAGAGVDRRLTKLLEHLFGSDTSQSMNLLRPDGPLGSLSAKIEVAFKTGIIDNELHRELHLLRKIRNKFAHSEDSLTFSNSPICDWVSELFIPAKVGDTESNQAASHREKFIYTIAKLMVYLEFLNDTRKPFTRRENELTRDLNAVIKRDV